MFWQRKKKPKYSDAEKKVLIDEVQVIRISQILTDSLELMGTTRNPQTFFGRYDTALSSAERILALTKNEETRHHALVTVDMLTGSKDEIVKTFVDRCHREGNLRAVKAELCSGKYGLSLAMIRYIGELTDQSMPENAAGTGKGAYIYCSLSFGEGGRTYYYKTEDETLRCGDTVLVPVGKEETVKAAKIVNIEKFKVGDAPYPPSRTKNIIRKV